MATSVAGHSCQLGKQLGQLTNVNVNLGQDNNPSRSAYAPLHKYKIIADFPLAARAAYVAPARTDMLMSSRALTSASSAVRRTRGSGCAMPRRNARNERIQRPLLG